MIFGVYLLAAGVFLAGCGRPPSNGGQHGEFSVNAIVAPAVEETVLYTIQLVGSLKARDSLDIVSEINAAVSEILFSDGQLVEQDQVLVKLDDAKIKARWAEAKARFGLAQTNFKRSRELFDSQTVSRQEFEQAEAEFNVAEAVYNLLNREVSDTVIKAPFAGVVSDRRISHGQYLTAGVPITRLVRIDPLEAEFRVPERHLSRVKKGQQIVLRSVAHPDLEITGDIFFIDPSINEGTRTVLVKALIPNPDYILKPGLFGALDVVLEEKAGAIVIPESSVRYAGDQASVVVMNGEGRAEFRNVKVGQRLPGRVEITEGLTAGEHVVVEGYQKMGPGTAIIISPASEKYGVTPPPSETAPEAE